MRAARFQGVGRGLVIEETPDPVPGPGQVVLNVGRCGICGTDLHQTSGEGGIGMEVGWIPGHEYAGEVVARGPGVRRLQVGDRVVAPPIAGCGQCASCLLGDPMWCTGEKPPRRLGAYAQYVLCNERETVMLPDALTWADGALVEPLAVGLHGVHLSELAPGATVAILGAGPIALASLFWARRRSAGAIAVCATSSRRRRFAEALGATAFIEGAEGRAEAVSSALGGPPDVVVEAVGRRGSIAEAIDLVAPRGTVIGLGWVTEPDTFLPVTALYKQVRLQFAMTYSMHDFQHVVDVLASGALEPRTMISSTVSLDELPTKFETLRGPTTECKVMIDPWA